ncbi:MAG: AI-2E family transporter [Patescibacteria group bacterium]
MSDKSDLVKVSFTYGGLLRFLLVVAIAFIAYYLRDLLIVLVTSVVVAAAVRPFARALENWHLPRTAAVLLVYVVAFSVTVGTVYFFIPPIFSELIDIASTIPHQLNTFLLGNPAWNVIAPLTANFVRDFSLADLANSGVSSYLPSIPTNVISTLRFLFNGIFELTLIIVISFYLAVQRHGIEDLIRLVVPLRNENYVLGLWKRVETKIGRWLQGQLLLGLIIGPIVFLGLTLLGVKYALTLAILASVFELIPLFGPILSSVPAILLGFSAGVPIGLMVLGLYVVVQQFENHLIYPLVVRKIIGVPPLVVIISLIVGANLAGFLGIILAVPAATLLMELVSDLAASKGQFRLQQKIASDQADVS